MNFFFSRSLSVKIYYLVGLSYIVRPKELFIKFNWPWSPSLGNCKNLEEMWSTKIYWRVCKDFLTQLYIPCKPGYVLRRAHWWSVTEHHSLLNKWHSSSITTQYNLATGRNTVLRGRWLQLPSVWLMILMLLYMATENLFSCWLYLNITYSFFE